MLRYKHRYTCAILTYLEAFDAWKQIGRWVLSQLKSEDLAGFSYFL